MTQHSDPASNAAKNQSNESVDNPVQSCPLRADWLTIKPLRYAIADDDSDAGLPDKLTISPDLPSLTQHKYIIRELLDQVVYLYHPEQHYLLEAVYDNNNDSPAVGRCVFGEPAAEVTDALPLFKQAKGSKVIMWLTHAPLTEARIKILEDNPDLIQEAGQHIDLAKAALDKASDTFPLFDIKSYLAELFPGLTEQLQWTSSPLLPADENALVCDYNTATPDNHYGVCLIDPITITSDLCREFSMAYEMVMKDMSVSNHPFQMAKLTQALINKEAGIARNSIPEYNEERLRKQFIDTSIKEILPLSQFDSLQAKIQAENERFDAVINRRLAQAETNIPVNRQARYDERKAELEALIHKEQMDTMLTGQSDAIQKQKKILEDLATDWLTWLKDSNGRLDLALAWFDDLDETQHQHKEALLTATINNINTFDQGMMMLEQWTSSLANQLDKDHSEVTLSGASAHYFVSLGFGVVITASKWLKAFNGLVSTVRTEINKFQVMFANKATPSTDVLLETMTAHLVKMGTSSEKGKALWTQTINNMSQRYGMQFGMVATQLDDVMFDVKASYAAVAAVTFNQRLLQEARSVVSGSNKVVNLFDLEQAGKVGGDPYIRDQQKYPRFFAHHMNAMELRAKNSKSLKALYEKSNRLFSSARQTKLAGIFTLVQLFNIATLYSTMEEDDSFKAKADFYTALFGLGTASLALVDAAFNQSFAGKSFSGYMKTTGADKIGTKTAALLQKVRPFDLLDMDKKLQMKTYEFIGSKASKFVNGAFRAMPLIGALVATFSSYLIQQEDSDQQQNKFAQSLSCLSMLANAGSAGFFLFAFFYSGPVLVFLGTVLGIAAIILSFWRDKVADDHLQMLLKTSYWGKADYKYQDNVHTLDDRQQLFARDTSDQATKDTLERCVEEEMRAFCDQLYKPVARITEQRQEGIFSIFTVKIALPHFVPRQSDVSFSLSGTWQHRKAGQRGYATDTVLLATHSEANRWQMNHVQGQFSMDSEQHHGYLTLTIDERQIMSIRDKNKQLDQAQKAGRNFLSYNLSLEYQHPAGLPICLTYPHIVIDDNKSVMSFWRNQTEIDAFAMEQAAS